MTLSRLCRRCSHTYNAHAHYRLGTECATCNEGDCPRFRPQRWWHRRGTR